MFCPRCGAQQPDGSVFCGACGIGLGGGNIAPTAQPPSPTPSSPYVAPAPPSPYVAPGQALVPVAPPQQYAPPPGYPPQVAPRASNPLALAGFLCGLFGLTPFWIGFLLCILAIVFSAIGMSKSSSLGGAGRGFAIAGLVLGIVFLTPAACGI